MGTSLRDGLRAGLGTMDEWRRDRLADLQEDAAEFEARGRQPFAEGLRNGRDVVAKTTSELRELGKQYGAAQTSPVRSQSRSATSLRPPEASKPSTARDQGDRTQQFLEKGRRLLAEAQQTAQTGLQRIGETRPIRDLAGRAAEAVGNAVGVGSGTKHMGQDLADGAMLAGRLSTPTIDLLISPPGESAMEQVLRTAKGLADIAKDAVDDPRGAASALVARSQKLLRDTVPAATPEAPTLRGEVRRRYDIGRHQGELAVEVLPYAVGAGELKATADLGALSKAGRVAKYVEQGFSKRQAARLAKPYDGMGHHAIISRRTRLPAWLGGGPVPRAILDSPFNVLKPRGMTQGDFYELHFGVDPQFYGAKVKSGRWSGKDLGIQRYDLPERIWHGTPNATKQAISGVGMFGTVPFSEGDPQ